MVDEDNRVYCNKAAWNKPPPVCKKSWSLKTACDYEDGICGWTQDWTDQFDWEIHSKKTPTKFTGPSNDHTYGNTSEGHYIYIEASAPRRDGDQAKLLSPLYNFKMQAVCFEFWFNMWCPTSQTKQVGSLEVFAIPDNKSLSSLVPLQTLTGDYGDSWNRERIQIDPRLGSFQILLQATRRLNHQNDIAVDDIQLWEGLCDDPPNIVHPSTKTLIEAPTFLEGKTVDTTIPTTLSIQPMVFTSTVNAPVYEVMTDKNIESITTQATSKEILVTRISSSTETKPTERRVSITNETTDFISKKIMDSSSMASITVAEAENQDNISNKFTLGPYSVANAKREIPRDYIENYTLLAIGITVALLFGIFVIFFIVWIWARNLDKKRAMAESVEDPQPITKADSICSEPNSYL